jgi:FAD/FMN-containing dehydrogenase
VTQQSSIPEAIVGYTRRSIKGIGSVVKETIMLTESQTQKLKDAVRGDLLRPLDSSYEPARKVFNAMIDRRPALIARCRGAADVVACVRFAREYALPISVRGGGHNVAGTAVCDDGLVIDLSGMKTVRVDVVRRTARADPGLVLAEFDHETQAFGLATTLGTVSMTGIAGLTLGGGLGWLMGQHGLACDNLVSVDLVTADGRFLTASARENADLFWGVRGGGGNFGVVTSFEYTLHPVSTVLAGLVAYPIREARDVLRFYRDFSARCPDELGLMPAMLTLPDGNTVVGVAGCYSGDLGVGAKVLQPLRSFGSPAADLFQPMPYIAVQKLIDWWAVPGQQHYWKSSFMRELSDDALDVLIDFAMRKPSTGCAILMELMHGAVQRIASDATAFAHRDARHSFLMLGRWTSQGENGVGMSWVREFWQAMQPFMKAGVYVNYLSDGEGEARVRDAYGVNYGRLLKLKDEYDPTNFFRMNQNIRSSKAAA